MLRAVSGILGILTAFFQDRILADFKGVTIENSDESAIRPWVSSGIQAEGIVVTFASLTGGRAYAGMMDLTGVFGAVVLMFPRLYRRFANDLLHEHSDEVEWNNRFTVGVRIMERCTPLL